MQSWCRCAHGSGELQGKSSCLVQHRAESGRLATARNSLQDVDREVKPGRCLRLRAVSSALAHFPTELHFSGVPLLKSATTVRGAQRLRKLIDVTLGARYV